MTIIEQIKAEIERLKGICTAQIKANPGQTFPFVMEMTGYDKLLSFLSTLEAEKPMNQEGVEEEVKMIDNILAELRCHVNYSVPFFLPSGTGVATYKYQTEIDWLKSLRPSWKPSDQDELMKLKYAGTSTKLD